MTLRERQKSVVRPEMPADITSMDRTQLTALKSKRVTLLL